MNTALIILLVLSGLDLGFTAGLFCFTAKNKKQPVIGARDPQFLTIYMRREVKLLSVYEKRYYNAILCRVPKNELVEEAKAYVGKTYDDSAKDTNVNVKVTYPVSREDLEYHYMFVQSVVPSQKNTLGPICGALATYMSLLATIEFRICGLYYNKINNADGQRMADELTQYMNWFTFILYEQKVRDFVDRPIEEILVRPDISDVLHDLSIRKKISTKSVFEAMQNVDLSFIMNLEWLKDHQHFHRTREPSFSTKKFKDKLKLFFEKPKKFLKKAGLKMANNYIAQPKWDDKSTVTIFPTSSSWFLPRHDQKSRKNFRTGMWKLILAFLWDEISMMDTFFSMFMSVLAGKDDNLLPKVHTTLGRFLWKIEGYEVIWDRLADLMAIKNTAPFSLKYDAEERYRNNPVRILRAMRRFQLGESSAEVTRNTQYYKLMFGAGPVM